MAASRTVPTAEPEAVSTRRWLTTEQALEILPVGERTFERWVATNTLVAYRVPGSRRRLFRIEDVEALPVASPEP